MARPRRPRPRAWLARGRDGSAAVEFAVIASFLGIAMMGVYDFGIATWHRMQVTTAAHAGAAYAAAHGFNANGITAAVTGSSDWAGIAASPAPSKVCGCPNNADGVVEVECGTACAGGGDAGTYVKVAATANYTFLMPYPGVTQPVVLTATSITRIQ